MPDAKHKNDIYGNVDDPKSIREERPATPAATVVLLRDAAEGPEVLMLRKNSKIAFGGMWVFPGGRIDAEDYAGGDDASAAARNRAAHNSAARNAAAREAKEEAGIALDPAAFVWFAHWTPPPSAPVRFATWFFAAPASDAGEQAVAIDDGEIKAHQWIRPADALAKHAEGEIDLVPPTWVTLYHIGRYRPVAALLRHLSETPPRTYETRAVKRTDGVRVALWRGDAGYDDWDADRPGPRHRLVMPADGFTFENDVERY